MGRRGQQPQVKPGPYANTQTQVEVTQYRDITGLFAKNGVKRWQFSTDDEHHMAECRFELPTGEWARVRLKAPIVEGMKPERIKQAERTIWRAMFYWLKSQFAAVEYGVFESREAFFAWLELMTPTGPVTVVEALLPQIDRVAERLMLMAPAKEEEE